MKRTQRFATATVFLMALMPLTTPASADDMCSVDAAMPFPPPDPDLTIHIPSDLTELLPECMQEIIHGLGEGVGVSSGLSVETSAPKTVVEGQKYYASATIRASDPTAGAVVQILAGTPNPESDPCHATGYSIDAGTNLGNNYYLITPEATASLGVDAMPAGEISVSWTLMADVPGRCDVELGVDNPFDLNSLGIHHLLTNILPDISLTQIDLGHIKTVGGQWVTDGARTITPPAASKVEITSTSTRVLATVSGAISHDDGWSWKDRGNFEITPPPDPSRLLPIPGVIPNIETVEYKQTLENDGNTIQPWLAIVDLAGSPGGTSNNVSMKGSYDDTGTTKGGIKEHRVEIIVTQNTQLTIDVLDDSWKPIVEQLLERFGSALVPTGLPNTFYYFEDMDSLGSEG